ncbi:MAG: PASTA domain-containing protein [Bacteroidota bacterium]|nr:PASTA domain-containing protein [Bacteroidota bacterium]
MAKKPTITHLFVHLGIIITLSFVILYIFFYMYLPSITHHGESIEVPDLRKKSFSEAKAILLRKKLRVVIYDSTYSSFDEPLSVINQFPKQGERVKSNRTIYLTIRSKNPPLVRMPKLITNSLKSAEITLKSYGLVLGNIKYIPSVNENAVLEQWSGRSRIEPGAFVPKGSVIHLVVGNGVSSESIIVPDLSGLTLDDAENILKAEGLEKGSVVYDENSSAPEGTIIKQKPIYIEGDTTNTIKIGEIIDLWVAGKKL